MADREMTNKKKTILIVIRDMEIIKIGWYYGEYLVAISLQGHGKLLCEADM